MANVAVAIAMEPTYIAYERPPDQQALWSAIPRGLRGFVVETGTLTAKPLNDTETIVLSGTLPGNFAYVFAEIGLTLRQDTMSDWDSEYTLNLQNYYQGGHLGLSGNWNFDLAIFGLIGDGRGAGHTATDPVPRAPMWAPRGTSGILIAISSFNSANPAAALGTIDCYINFWEFDLEQIRKYPINAPFPTHSR